MTTRTATGFYDIPELISLGQAHRPGETGRFGTFGGRFIPETLMGAVLELQEAFEKAWSEPEFVAGWLDVLQHYAGRPTPLYFAERVSQELGFRVYIKREDLNHTGAHKINNTLGQALLCQRMGKRRVIAETGAGQHGVATATAAARYGLDCKVFMGAKDVVRQAPNVQRMKMLGAEVIPVDKGTQTLKDATNEALRYWVTNVADTHYIIGSAVGPHPYPWMVRAFQSVIGYESRRQILDATGKLPAAVIACVGGGSNSIGIFHAFREDASRLLGAEAGGLGYPGEHHGASIEAGEPGVLHGSLSMLMMDENGQVQEAHSVSAGLDYPGVGPELAHLAELNRAEFIAVTDAQALDAFQWFTRQEGIVPALESAHAVGLLRAKAKEFRPDDVVLLNLSGRGDKDLGQVEKLIRV